MKTNFLFFPSWGLLGFQLVAMLYASVGVWGFVDPLRVIQNRIRWKQSRCFIRVLQWRANDWNIHTIFSVIFEVVVLNPLYRARQFDLK